MKQKLLARLVLGAIAGVTAVGVAQAGQIQSASTNVAREAIVANEQSIYSPAVTYRFFGDVNASTGQAVVFQVQYHLVNTAGGDARWNKDNPPQPSDFRITPTTNVTGGLDPLVSTALVPNEAPGVFIDAIEVVNEGKTLFATFRVTPEAGFSTRNNDGSPIALPGTQITTQPGLIGQPIIALNAGNAITRAQITNLSTAVGSIMADYQANNSVCSRTPTLGVEFKHFVGVQSPTMLADGVSNGTADEHVRQQSTNSATIVTFPTVIVPEFAAANGRVITDPSTNHSRFTVRTAGTGANRVDGSANPAELINLGSVTFARVSAGYDLDLVNFYANTTPDYILQAGTAGRNDGPVETARAVVTLTASAGFAANSRVSLNSSATCAAGSTISNTVVVGADTGNSVELDVNSAAIPSLINAGGKVPSYVCYDVAGVSTPIPGSAFTAVGQLIKARDQGADRVDEQDNICQGPLYALSGGIKIDVRNYAAPGAAGGWQSMIRLINNSEIRTVDVYGQYINRDGSYGKWGKITTLKPREAQNWAAGAIDGKLISAPATGGLPENANTAGSSGANMGDNGDAAPRLRITSEQASSLRVQNYMVNPANGAVMEFSSSQGVDFDLDLTTRAPGEAQHIDQDAQAGLNGK